MLQFAGCQLKEWTNASDLPLSGMHAADALDRHYDRDFQDVPGTRKRAFDDWPHELNREGTE